MKLTKDEFKLFSLFVSNSDDLKISLIRCENKDAYEIRIYNKYMDIYLIEISMDCEELV